LPENKRLARSFFFLHNLRIFFHISQVAKEEENSKKNKKMYINFLLIKNLLTKKKNKICKSCQYSILRRARERERESVVEQEEDVCFFSESNWISKKKSIML